MTPRKSFIATDALLLAASLAVASAALAAPAAVVVHASGALLTQDAAGRIKALSADSSVSTGDTLVTGRETFAEVRFADGAIVTLGPDTRMAIEAYAFDAASPAGDRSQLALATGTLHVTPGAMARRSADRQVVSTPSGAIKGGASSFVIEVVPGDAANVAAIEPIRLAALSLTLSDAMVIAQALPGPAGAKAPGLYVQVIDGLINLSNGGGSQSFAAGQFGYTPSFKQPPIVLPTNPGLQFTPPPGFSASNAPQSGSGGGGKSANVDCEVR
jgi:hypothetical protein